MHETKEEQKQNKTTTTNRRRKEKKHSVTIEIGDKSMGCLSYTSIRICY